MVTHARPTVRASGVVSLFALLLVVCQLPACGGGSSENNSPPVTSSPAPEDACTAIQTFRRYAESSPPSYTAILAWANAMTTSSSQSAATAAKVEVDYMRLLQADSFTSPTSPVPGAVDEYSVAKPRLGLGEGAVYPRVPRCQPGASDIEIAGSLVAGGHLTIDLSSARDKYAHWQTPRASLIAGKVYLVEARFRVTGAAYIQFGIDYWRTLNAGYAGYDELCVKSNNCEGWVSNWFGDTAGQFVTRTVPVR